MFRNNDRDKEQRGGDFKRSSFSGEKRSFGGDRPSFGDRPRFGGDRGGFGGGDRGGFGGGDRGGRERGGFGGRGGDRGFKKPEARQQVIYFDLQKGATMPKYMTEASTGADVFYPGDAELVIHAGDKVTIATGVVAKFLPPRLEVQVRSRSSLAAKGLLLLAPAAFSGDDIDRELVLTFMNLGKDSITIKSQERICQLVFSFVQRVAIEAHTELSKSGRNDGGFGSTGA